ncbi:MAG: class I SAM-dependent methyltransferase [Myxococcaceae bacterium]
MSTDDTRRSWNLATRNHNAHKGDQAARLRSGIDPLFPEELELLGKLEGRRLVHLQCNSGQDSLGLARRGATVTGVDFSDEAIAFARRLSAESGIAAEFVEAEVIEWLHSTPRRFELAFASYGVTGWLKDLDAWARGIARVLEPGGRFVYVEFHPLVWSFDAQLALHGDDYFATEPFLDPVSDYVAESGSGLGAVETGATVANTIPATSWQHGVGEVVSALAGAGLVLEVLREWPYSNGCRLKPGLVAIEGRRFGWPPGVARVPLMFGLSARRG